MNSCVPPQSACCSVFFSLHLLAPGMLSGFVAMWRLYRASWVAETVKNLTVMQENWVESLGRGDRLEEDMATHSTIVAWQIPWTKEPGRLQSMGLQRVRYD